MNKTEGVRLLVQDVLRTILEPYAEDIIWDVFMQIENNRDWKRRYDELEDELTKDVVNKWIGKYAKDLTGLNTIRQVDAPEEGHIVGSYTKLRYQDQLNETNYFLRFSSTRFRWIHARISPFLQFQNRIYFLVSFSKRATGFQSGGRGVTVRVHASVISYRSFQILNSRDNIDNRGNTMLCERQKKIH